MAELLVTVDIMLPIFLMLGLGWLLARIGWMKPPVTSGVNSLIFKLFLPVLLFNNIRGLSVTQSPDLSFALYLFFGVLAVFLLAMALVPRFERDVRKQGVMVQGIFRTNFAILGIPLMEAMFGAPGVTMVSLALPVVIPLNNVLAVIALSAPEGRKASPWALIRSMLTNPLIVGCALGGLCLLFRLTLPACVDKTLTQLGALASPLSLLVLGASLHWQGVKDNGPELLWTVLLKQLIIPVAMLIPAVALGFRGEALGVMIILFGAPCAVSSYPMAQAMGGDGPLAANQVVLTTIFSMGTLFGLIYLGKLLGYL